MVWQDMVIAIANLLFTFSIFSQVHHGFKRKKGFVILQTSGLTSLGLYAIAIAFFTLSLYFSAIIASINATLWAILFVQRIVYTKAL
ncbi:hypothetical protein HOL21_02130 [Candidatus Woesearchaeota archaeon]|jgi:hypothetical protein|nr:hypothetical protein [Candidatus Woesearchaeota archaeon]MBT5396989.1 hypothetical protein [Candidatus Woesearchaeota archaeon]MBT6367465.1 hypothetical protein [Candidatus Woesearchaeota archaeon]MBT7762389.1 hypothetical protein [Candidatus Woesearchaeota archaeon]